MGWGSQSTFAQFTRETVRSENFVNEGDTSASLRINLLSGAVDEKYWYHTYSPAGYTFNISNDAEDSFFNVWQVGREGNTAHMTVGASWLEVNNGVLALNKGTNVSSASTLILPNDGNYYSVNGTTTITQIQGIPAGSPTGVDAGTQIILEFNDSLTLEHDVILLQLPGGVDLITQTGDIGIFAEYSSGFWKCVSWQSGASVATGDVTGPAGATANSIPTLDASGKILTESLATIAPTTGTLTLSGTAKSIIPSVTDSGSIGNNTNTFDQGWFSGDVKVGRLIAGGGDPTFPTIADIGIIGEKVDDPGQIYLKDLETPKTFGDSTKDGTLLESNEGIFSIYGMSYSGTKTTSFLDVNQVTDEVIVPTGDLVISSGDLEVVGRTLSTVGILGSDAVSFVSSDTTIEDLVIYEEIGDSGMSIISGTNDTGAIRFGDQASADVAGITYNHQFDEFRIDTPNGVVLFSEDGYVKVSSAPFATGNEAIITSADQLPLAASNTNSFRVDVGGVTIITKFDHIQSGTTVTLRFTGVMTLQDNGSLINLPNDQDIITTDGDVATFYEGSFGWYLTSYVRADSIYPSRSAINGTGLITGGVLSIDTDTTKFDLTSGTGQITDLTDPLHPVVITVTWDAFDAQTVTNIGTQASTNILIDSSGSIIQQATGATDEQHRTHIVIGGLSHIDNVNVGDTFQTPVIASNLVPTVNELAQAVGVMNQTGNIFSPNSTDLTLAKNSGTYFSMGAKFDSTPNSPNLISSGALAGLSFSRIYDDGAGNPTFGALVTTIDPANYDDGDGVLGTVPGSDWQVKRIFVYPNSGFTLVQYGESTHATLSLAIDSITSNAGTSYPEFGTAILRGWIVIQKGTTDLNDATFITAGKFGETGSVSSGSSTTTLQNAYDNSGVPQILTDALNGAVEFERGSASDTDKVIVVNNGASTEVFSITGEGVVSVEGSIGSPAQTATGDGTTIIDWDLGNFLLLQLDNAGTNEDVSFTAPTNPGVYVLKIIQGTSGGATAPTWDAEVKWVGGVAPTLTTTATTGTDLIKFFFDGTNYYGTVASDFQ